ncbi:hypothetical protein [Campylobacter concisus]|nr:hypothetical protein [Campylobacter concisus]
MFSTSLRSQLNRRSKFRFKARQIVFQGIKFVQDFSLRQGEIRFLSGAYM